MKSRLGTRLLFALAAGLLSVAVPLATSAAFARDLTAPERGALARAVARFDAAMRRKDVPAIIGVVPPRIITHIATQHGVDPAKLRRVMIQQTRHVMASSVLHGYRMDIGQARYGATGSGAPYALIPTSTTLDLGGRLSEKRTNTLAMQDGGRWYLLDLNDAARVAMFTQVYPEFQGVPLGGQGI